MRICLFEDDGVLQLEPLSLTRPVFDLLCGLSSLAAKQCRHFAPCEVGYLVRPCLADLVRLNHAGAPVNDLAWLRAEATVLVNARWLPAAGGVVDLAGPGVALVGEEVAYAVLGPSQLTYCSLNTLGDCQETWKQTLPHRPADGRLVHFPWDLVDHNGEQLALDFAQLGRPDGQCRPSHFALVGPGDLLLIDPSAEIDPHVVADTRRGPVVIDRQAVVTAFSRLEGPCYIGPQTQVLGARIRGGTTLGPNCRIGGEVEASIVHGHSNKYHDGFLGHSYLGEWINLGAGTHNSDLRNDYGEVSVVINGERVGTGLNKVGCFIGDHTKTGLGTLLNTGSHIGAFCNLLPAGGFLPKYVPSFATCWNGALDERADLAGSLRIADRAMQRRECALTPVHAALYQTLFEQTAGERRQAVREAEQRRLRRSA
jgi:UDP-N-acetylglucosamine diphosphorylase/glucosamine-1-phosphate N-acetyltransferase